MFTILLIFNILFLLIIIGMFFLILIILTKIDNNLLERDIKDKKLVKQSLDLAHKIIDKIGGCGESTNKD